jgi:hypothetical protein
LQGPDDSRRNWSSIWMDNSARTQCQTGSLRSERSVKDWFGAKLSALHVETDILSVKLGSRDSDNRVLKRDWDVLEWINWILYILMIEKIRLTMRTSLRFRTDRSNILFENQIVNPKIARGSPFWRPVICDWIYCSFLMRRFVRYFQSFRTERATRRSSVSNRYRCHPGTFGTLRVTSKIG